MEEKSYDILIIGGGASGLFASALLSEYKENFSVAILEKTNKLLSKVKVSGGGRCNVTNACSQKSSFSKAYPRGKNRMKKNLDLLSNKDTVAWFEKNGVEMKTEADGRIFPRSDSSQSVMDCLLNKTRSAGYSIYKRTEAEKIEKNTDGFRIETKEFNFQAKQILLCTGGFRKIEDYHLLTSLGHEIIPPIPSLFTFNTPKSSFLELAGVSVPEARVKIPELKINETGALLFTHWGISGPAVLKASAFAARELNQKNYEFKVYVSWNANFTEAYLEESLNKYKITSPKQTIIKHPLFDLPKRLWLNLCASSEISDTKIWAELSKKSKNKLIQSLLSAELNVSGKTTFKEEFVSCGGVSLSEIDSTMQSNKAEGLYLAGEVLDVDGITGGYNFQNAWSGAYIATKAMAKHFSS